MLNESISGTYRYFMTIPALDRGAPIMQSIKKSQTLKKRTVTASIRESVSEKKKPVAKRPLGVNLKITTHSKSNSSAGVKSSVKQSEELVAGVRRAATLLKQVSDATRLQILIRLLESEYNVGTICNLLGSQSQPAVSHHLAKLRDGRLIEPRREGKNNVYALTKEGELLAQTVKSLIYMKS